MLASELDFPLPSELIAQEPIEPRDAARLMVLHRDSGSLMHQYVSDLPDLLRGGDLLVLNDSRVLRARLRGHKRDSGGKVEALLLREVKTNLWEALLKPSARLRVGTAIAIENHSQAVDADRRPVIAEVIDRTPTGWLLRFQLGGDDIRDVREILPLIGEVPLPPYIKKPPRDEGQYQTTFARPALSTMNGVALDSAAAPTAGLHFTPALLDALHEHGVATAFVTLGVGLGTFRPIQAPIVEDHVMHAEDFFIPEGAARAICDQKRRGGRVVSVGTTSTRVLESASQPDGTISSGAGSTSIFIRPGYRFRCVDAMITNFHLPRSTLLAMIAAFVESVPLASDNRAGQVTERGLTGLEKIRYAYSQAVEHRYRFFSFGDAMLIE